MSLTRTLKGKHPTSGLPLYHYDHTDETGESCVLFTGLATGDVTLADGTVYGVDAEVIECKNLAHAHEVAHHIGVQLEQTGQLDVPGDENDGVPIPFLHGPCPHCGAGAPYVPAEVQRFATRAEEVAHRTVENKRGSKR